MLKLIGLGGIDLLGISLDAVTAFVLVAGGVYVLAYLRWVGAGLIALGVAVGAVAYGQTLGAASCISAERLAAVTSERDSALAQVRGWQATADVNRKNADRMREERGRANAELAKWKQAADKLSKGRRDARAATGDDDRRLCRLVQGRASGC